MFLSSSVSSSFPFAFHHLSNPFSLVLLSFLSSHASAFPTYSPFFPPPRQRHHSAFFLSSPLTFPFRILLPNPYFPLSVSPFSLFRQQPASYYSAVHPGTKTCDCRPPSIVATPHMDLYIHPGYSVVRVWHLAIPSYNLHSTCSPFQSVGQCAHLRLTLPLD